jgi:hypothetical protein
VAVARDGLRARWLGVAGGLFGAKLGSLGGVADRCRAARWRINAGRLKAWRRMRDHESEAEALTR